ncbi:hypothetical protein DICVIV_00304 [Dictyocaulus viviparus]|uniref:Uncharacterized protein n=1 Tax=Dictyocaulus viviparus TaxID=29172 RepID=A0A0D8YBX4_DICVI|nr:hypothetical protein DICVIV_00304 [Dictyocaulus viviparus]
MYPYFVSRICVNHLNLLDQHFVCLFNVKANRGRKNMDMVRIVTGEGKAYLH